MTEVQKIMGENNEINELTQNLLSTYSNFSRIKTLQESTGPENEFKKLIPKIINALLNILKKIVDFFQEVYYNYQDILSVFFDTFIESILKYTIKTKEPLPLTFKQIYEFFNIFGLNLILKDTFDRISATFQWKIITSDWIDMDFIMQYKNSMNSRVSIETMQAINDLNDMVMMVRREEELNRHFEEELKNIID